MRMYQLSLLAIYLAFCSTTGQAAIEMPGFFGDHMVMQRDVPLAIWGKAAAGQRITVRFASQSKTISADAAGGWQAALEAMPAGGPYTLAVSGGGEHLTFTDIYLGDVWVFSGQSNMQVSFDYFLELPNIEEKYKERFRDTLKTCRDDKRVRIFMAATRDAKGETIRNRAENRWLTGDPNDVRHCNPVGYYFAREVAAKTGVMTAAVRIAWGGQYIERFYRGADIYEYMLKPWGPFPIKGAAWYQGESNLHKDGDRLGYALKLQLLIRDYRTLWNNPNLPFLIIQLPPARYSERPFNDENSLPVFLEAQRQALAIGHTAMVNTSDLGMSNGLHQPQKYEVAVRLANLALGRVYGFTDAVPAGPQYKSYQREGGKLRVLFDTFGSALATTDGQPPRFFEILPEGQKEFVPAQTKIEGNTVVVWKEDAPKIADVRFAFREQDLPNVNLTNTEGIPAATFWAGATRQLHPEL